MWVVPEIDPDLCEGCGRCVVECPGKAVSLVSGRAVVIRPEDCSYCAECETICRSGAIRCPFEIVISDIQVSSSKRKRTQERQ